MVPGAKPMAQLTHHITQRPIRTLALALAAVMLVAMAGYGLYQYTLSIDASVDPGAGGPPPQTGLERTLETIRAKHKVPALAGAVLRGAGPPEVAAVGVRRAGRPERVTDGDRFHLGSDTKAMTATLVALLVEEGRLRWDTTLAELFPELAPEMDPGYRAATVEMLLHHEAGLPDDRWNRAHGLRLAGLRGSPAEQRLRATRLALARPPAYVPGTRNVYANMSFTILGAAVERLTGESWEEQLSRRVFEPLGMAGAGFDSPSTQGMVDQPWGHVVSRRGRCRLLSCASFERLHREHRKGSGFAGGSGVSEGPTGTVLEHSGSEGWWYAIAVLDPARGEAYLVAVNIGGDRGAAACEEAITTLRSGPGSGL